MNLPRTKRQEKPEPSPDPAVLVDDYGNQMEIRYFPGHKILQLVAEDGFVFRPNEKRDHKNILDLIAVLKTWEEYNRP